MHKKAKVLLIILSVLILLIIFSVVTINKINQEMKQLESADISELDFKQVEDGTYEGTYDSLLIKVKVTVTISNHKITEIIILEHQNGQGDDAEIIIDSVKVEQSTNVDLISGATYSSKAILLSIIDALLN